MPMSITQCEKHMQLAAPRWKKKKEKTLQNGCFKISENRLAKMCT